MSAVSESKLLPMVRDMALDSVLKEAENGELVPTKKECDELGIPKKRTNRGSAPLSKYEDPTNSLELALIARRYVRGMIRVLVQIAKDPKQSPAARVQAAKEIINRAVIEKSELDLIDDARLKAMAEALVAKLRSEQDTQRQVEARFVQVAPAVVVERYAPYGGASAPSFTSSSYADAAGAKSEADPAKSLDEDDDDAERQDD